MTTHTPGVDPTRLDSYLVVALEKLAMRPRALIALDFDGCLAPLVDDPTTSRPLPEASAALEEIAIYDDVELALVSGRPAGDLIHLASPPPSTWIIGSHGAEFGHLDSHGEFVQQEFGLTPAQRETLTDLTRRVEELAKGYARVWVEHKPAAVVLHTRLASEEVGHEARQAVADLVDGWDGVYPMDGNQVVELAVVEATKGQALTSLRTSLQHNHKESLTVLYAGDDVTDETALATLESTDIGIKVGDAPTVAQFWVTDPPAMAAALQLYVHHLRKRRTP